MWTYDVDIYVDVDNHNPRPAQRIYGCVLSCESIYGNPVTMDIFWMCEGTYHQCFIKAVIAALKRMKKPSRICIHGPDAYVLNMIDHNINMWAGSRFASAKGQPIRNAELWQELWELLKLHEYRTVAGEHEYSDWLVTELARRKNAAQPVNARGAAVSGE